MQRDYEDFTVAEKKQRLEKYLDFLCHGKGKIGIHDRVFAQTILHEESLRIFGKDNASGEEDIRSLLAFWNAQTREGNNDKSRTFQS